MSIASDPMPLVRELAAFPHRGTTSVEERRAAELLASRLSGPGVEVQVEPFRTPRVYIWEVWWFLAGLVLALVGASWAPWTALLVATASAACGLLFLDYRWSPLSLLVPHASSQNVVARQPVPGASRRLILMAHYDSAPNSLVYHPLLVKGFRRSMLMNAALLLLAAIATLVEALAPGHVAVAALRLGLVAYFLAQGVLVSLDYLRLGYTNGAADNATGTAAAASTAARLWARPLPGWEVTLVLTGAEEAVMVGSSRYFAAHAAELDPARTVVLNFDNLGAGAIRVLTRSGSLTSIHYDNALVRAALEVAGNDPRFSTVKEGEWRTGDFDTLAFARAGVPALTLVAVDATGVIPHLHRPSDVVAHVDAAVPALAADFAEAVVRRMAA